MSILSSLFRKPKEILCPRCGYSGAGFLPYRQKRSLIECPACGALIDLGFGEEEKTELRAAEADLRRQEFAVAEEKFFDILSRFPDNHEAYWGYVCARYGLKIEQDDDGSFIPTCCLDSITDFENDPHFLRAVELAPPEIADWYRGQAEYVGRISRKWMEEAKREEPYDVFICFKDSDREKGIERTKDSYEAFELYTKLKDKGYRVFYSRESLHDKTGEKYEPFIFNALQTAKVMIVFGLSADYIQSTWVKNEWQRYIKRIAAGDKREKSLVVIYSGFDPGTLPSMLARRECLEWRPGVYSILYKYLDGFFKKEKKDATPVAPKTPAVTPSIEAKSAPRSFTPLTEAEEKEHPVFSPLHEHMYTERVIPASCVTRGYTLHTCACGHEYKDSFTPLGEHDFRHSRDVAPTCTKAGQHEFVCTVCGDKKVDPIPATGHKFGKWLTKTAAGCEIDGVSARQCENCGRIESKSIPATGHKFGKWIEQKKAGCTEPGEKVRQCSLCGKTEREALPALGHDFSEWKASKTSPDREERFCRRCGEEETREKKTKAKTASKKSTPSALSSAKVGDFVTFGSYPQDENGKKQTPIEWQVLAKENDRLLVVSEYGLDCQPYNTTSAPVTWETCSLRKWLNDTFLNNAFTAEERASIPTVPVDIDRSHNYGNPTQDQVFLLSNPDVNEFFISCGKSEKCVATDYAKAIGVWTSDPAKAGGKTFCWWWTRSPGLNSDHAVIVRHDRGVNEYGYKVEQETGAVRPAMWLDVSGIPEDNNPKTDDSNVFYYHGQDTELINKTKYSKVIVENGCAGIKKNAFSGWKKLSSVTIPDSVTSIGNSAFCRTGLTSITLPSSVTNIGECAFCNCTSLTSVTIPASVTSIGNDAFSCCTELSSITVAADNPVYHSAGNCLIETESKTLINGCQTSIIPTDGSVTSIRDHAFLGCSILASITIPDSVTSIGEEAFGTCSRLTSVTIPASVTSIGGGAFMLCTGLTSVTIPASVTSIGGSAFALCTGLTSIIIPDSVTSIGSTAFYNCRSLTSVTIPDSVTSIGSEAFRDCSRLTSVTFNGTKAQWNAVSKGSNCFFNIGSYMVRCADGDIFFKTNPIESAEFQPKTEEDTFYYHGQYTRGIDKTKYSKVIVEDGCKEIKRSAFQGWESLISVIISESVTRIGNNAFLHCGLTSINIPNSVTSIKGGAFFRCSGLISVTISDSVTSIGSNAFYGCSKLTSITFSGTKAQWNAISKASDWNSGTGSYIIHCTDGDV